MAELRRELINKTKQADLDSLLNILIRVLPNLFFFVFLGALDSNYYYLLSQQWGSLLH